MEEYEWEGEEEEDYGLAGMFERGSDAVAELATEVVTTMGEEGQVAAAVTMMEEGEEEAAVEVAEAVTDAVTAAMEEVEEAVRGGGGRGEDDTRSLIV